MYQIPYVYEYVNGKYHYHTRAMFLNLLKMTYQTCSQGCTFNNCSISNTRSCAITDPGINTAFINTRFAAICSNDKAFGLTPMLCDVEEDGFAYSNLTFENCVLTRRETRPNYDNDQTVIGGLIKGLNIINSVGVSISGSCPDSYIADSTMGILRVEFQGGHRTNHRAVIKRIQVVNSGGNSTPGSIECYSEAGRNKDMFPVLEAAKSCWEPVTKEMSIEDSFLVKQTNGTSVGDSDKDTEYQRAEKALRRPYRANFVGRAYKVINNVTENYTEIED